MKICKCCGAPAAPFAEVDASRSCEDRHGTPVFPPSGRQIPYLRCSRCGFVFTDAFDALTDEQLGAAIYNADYARADPDFAEARPRFLADALAEFIAPLEGTARCLDFGGGRGLLAELMRGRGCRIDTWDPYFDRAQEPDRQSYDLVTAFEVVEHSRDPVGTFRQIASLLRPGGVAYFTTHLLPRGAGADWWYLAPRNGHVSLHTPASLRACAEACGMEFLMLAEASHLMLPRGASEVARRLVRSRAQAALWTASQRGVGELCRAAWRVGRAGAWRAALAPRHFARAALRGG